MEKLLAISRKKHMGEAAQMATPFYVSQPVFQDEFIRIPGSQT
jgi:hypothetical protein